MKYIAILTAAAMLAPGYAAAEYLCEKQWNKKHVISCPAGSTWDARSATCIVNG